MDSWRHVLEICSKASADTALLCGRIDTDEDEVSLLDALVDVGGKEEVAASAIAHDVLEARFVDRELEVGAVPGVDACLVEVDDGDRNLRALEGNNRTSRSTYASCQYASRAIATRAQTHQRSQHRLFRERNKHLAVVDDNETDALQQIFCTLTGAMVVREKETTSGIGMRSLPNRVKYLSLGF